VGEQCLLLFENKTLSTLKILTGNLIIFQFHLLVSKPITTAQCFNIDSRSKSLF
jgi:hypothetical protein